MNKLAFSLKMIGRCRPWWLPFADRFGWLSAEREYSVKYNRSSWQVRARVGDVRVLNEIFIHGSYDAALRALSPGSIVIDIGANIGAFTIAAAHAGAARVFAFEPVPANLDQLRKNVSLNRLEGVVKIEPQAVAGKVGTLALFVRENDAGGGTAFPEIHQSWHAGAGLDPDVKKIEVGCTTLGQILAGEKLERCDLLKLDCEGAEYEIINSFDFETARKIKAVTFEFHSDGKLEKILELLKGLGFDRCVQQHPYQVIYATRS